MELLCWICEEKKVDVVRREFIKADGICEVANVCDDCIKKYIQRPDKNSCEIHKEEFVIFIDFTSACRQCIERDAKAEKETNLSGVRKEWKMVCRLATRKDGAEFLKLVRASTQPRLSKELCWLCAKHAKAQRYNLTPDQVVREAVEQLKINKSLVVTMLPSSDPNKRYCPPSS